MRKKILLGTMIVSVAVVSLLIWVKGLVWAQGPVPQGIFGTPVTMFTYQGRLVDGGIPATGSYDFRFELYGDSTGNSQVGGTVFANDVAVTQGLFTVDLEFGMNAVNGYPRYLEIGVRPGESAGDYETLSPRQELPAAPHALALPGLYTQPNITSTNVIAGGSNNNVVIDVVGATISGGGGSTSPNEVMANYGTVSGGERNIARNDHATVGGGLENEAVGFYTTIGGGWGNTAGAEEGSTIAGGKNNIAVGVWNAIGGGMDITVFNDFATVGGGELISVTGRAAVVAGGSAITVTGDYAAVSGGQYNAASGQYATVGGGNGNTAVVYAATIGGGEGNTAGGSAATVAGGKRNTAGHLSATVGGGEDNTADGAVSTVAGGAQNTASGEGATVAGGVSNIAAGSRSFAAGYRATIDADHDGAFLFSDFSQFDFNSAAANEFAVRATGGVRFVTAIDESGDPSAGARLASGSGSWSSLSDREAKANFAPVDGHEILVHLDSLPIEVWNYKGQDPAIHHIGPTAQDFRAAFGLGEDNRHISTVDADGVALAAIQGLYHMLQEKDTQISAMKAQNAAQQKQITALEVRLAALEQAVSANGTSTHPVRASISSASPTALAVGWSLFVGLSLIGLVLGQRRQGGR